MQQCRPPCTALSLCNASSDADVDRADDRVGGIAGVSVPLATALLVATSASLHLVDLLILGANVAEDLQFRGSRGGQALRLASLRALLRGHMREDADVIRRPKLPWFSPQQQGLWNAALCGRGGRRGDR